MNRDDIIRMAREAGFHIMRGSKGDLYALSYEHMEKFAKLVAEYEREECALIAERHSHAATFLIRERGAP